MTGQVPESPAQGNKALPQIGVVAKTMQHLGELSRVVKGAGFHLAAFVDAAQGLPESVPAVDVWVVNIDLDDLGSQSILDHLEAQHTPIIFDDDLVSYSASTESKAELPADIRIKRERRLAEKVQNLLNASAVQGEERARAQQLWVLAASTGGPDAVLAFIKSLPKDLPKAAFLYVQHIEDQGFQNLLKVVAKHSDWPVYSCSQTHTLRERSLYLVDPAHQIEITESGVISPNHSPWSGQYKPSINQVIAKVARAYGKRGGAIVFTGMGDDGADSCTLLHHRGGQVWIQSPETCTVDSMPVSVQSRASASFSASPELLAQKLGQYCRQL